MRKGYQRSGFKVAYNGRNYMQLPILKNCIVNEALRRQLTYSFCYSGVFSQATTTPKTSLFKVKYLIINWLMSGHKCSKMEAKEKQKILKRMRKAEYLILKGQSDLSTLAEIVQPLFDQEIYVVWSTDGARVIDDNGELGSFEEFLNEL